MPRCSIIIPVHNWASLTRQCLNQLLAAPPLVDCETIVVDDASNDSTRQLLAGYGDRIRVVTHDTNSGFGQACNDGAAAATASDYLVLLNNDTIPHRGWLDALVRYADAHPRAAVVGSKLVFPNDTIQHAGVVICQDRLPRHLYNGFPADHPAVNKSRRFQIVTAGCALVRRTVWDEAGGFDTAFHNGYEDVDLCLRLGAAGHEVHYCHESVICHLESLSRATRPAEYEHNDALYRARWASRVTPDDLGYYVEDGLLKLTYWDSHPLHVALSPLLGVTGEGERGESDRILAARAHQVFELLRANIRLTTGVREAQLRAAAASPAATNGPAAGAPAAAFTLYGRAVPLEQRPLDLEQLLHFDRERQPEVRDAFLQLNELHRLFDGSPFIAVDDHHVRRDDAYRIVHQQFVASGIPVEDFPCDAAAFQRFLDAALPTYERTGYLAGNGGLGGYFPQKAFEHWISATYLQWSPKTVVLDLASELSPAVDVLAPVRPADFYRHDIQLATDLARRTISGFANAIESPDALFDCIMAHCAIDNFEGSADTDVFREAVRILKPGGRILITPLHMASVFENRVALGAPGVQVDEGAVICLGFPGSLRFARHYSVEALRRRVIDAVPGLRFHVVHVRGLPSDRHPATATNRFMLVGTKPT